MDATEGFDEVVHEPGREFVESTNVWQFMQTYGIDDYEELIERTTTEIDGEPDSGVDWFWDELPAYLDVEFYEPYDTVRDDSDGPQFTDWYPGGEINIAHNTLDRYAEVDAPERNKVACIWEGEDGDVREETFHDLYRQANRVANYLEDAGIGTGDTVGLYMPMVPEVISILYGCFKVGAIAVPIFSGFGVEATATRLDDAEPSVLFTGDGFYRRGSPVRLKEGADEAIEQAGHVETVVVYDRLGDRENPDVAVPWNDDRDEWWDDAVAPRPASTTPSPCRRTRSRCCCTLPGPRGSRRGSSTPTPASSCSVRRRSTSASTRSPRIGSSGSATSAG
ncbi:acetyl-coenzyme A synthetase [Halolamina pelagica]|uniref:Acetyl-coenzyme A synthetase n=1 Tax=Halolamina pelagica TaxID=699431 RepID=A0A0P7I3B7_9EURY|nr:acetyl-coenzyme A synthetase [Halolamina pelagica]